MNGWNKQHKMRMRIRRKRNWKKSTRKSVECNRDFFTSLLWHFPSTFIISHLENTSFICLTSSYGDQFCYVCVDAFGLFHSVFRLFCLFWYFHCYASHFRCFFVLFIYAKGFWKANKNREKRRKSNWNSQFCRHRHVMLWELKGQKEIWLWSKSNADNWMFPLRCFDHIQTHAPNRPLACLKWGRKRMKLLFLNIFMFFIRCVRQITMKWKQSLKTLHIRAVRKPEIQSLAWHVLIFKCYFFYLFCFKSQLSFLCRSAQFIWKIVQISQFRLLRFSSFSRKNIHYSFWMNFKQLATANRKVKQSHEWMGRILCHRLKVYLGNETWFFNRIIMKNIWKALKRRILEYFSVRFL